MEIVLIALLYLDLLNVTKLKHSEGLNNVSGYLLIDRTRNIRCYVDIS